MKNNQQPKAREGDRIIIVNPDEVSRRKGVEKGQVGKVVLESISGCFAINPSWGKKRIGFLNSEFEVLKDVKSRDEG